MTIPGTRGVCPVCHMASGTNVRGFFNEAYPLFSVGLLAPTELHCLDASCGTVVPSQVSLSQVEVWRHTAVSYVRNRTLEDIR